MLAAVYYGKQDIRVVDVPKPEIGPGELLIKVLSASICGTDMRIYNGAHRFYPEGTIRIPGHEVVGTIEEIGPGLDRFSIGQRVFIAPNMGCGHCIQCISGNNNLCADFNAIGITIDGGFAEYMRVPAAAVQQGCVINIKEDVDPAVAALTEPFACVLRGQKILNIKPGNVALVIGAGPIGIMHAKLAKVWGAGRVIVSEPIPSRAEQARRMGADRVVNPTVEDLDTVVKAESNGRGADVIIVAAPVHAAQESALSMAAIGGRINFFGGLPKDNSKINFDSNIVHYKELIVTATTACSTDNCWQAAQIINAGLVDLSDLISSRFALKDAKEAFAEALEKKALKIVIEP